MTIYSKNYWISSQYDGRPWSLSFSLVGGPLGLTVGGKRASSSSFHSLTMKKKLSPAQPFLFPMWPCPTYFFPLPVLTFIFPYLSKFFVLFYTSKEKGDPWKKGGNKCQVAKKIRRSYFMRGRELWLTRQNNIFSSFPYSKCFSWIQDTAP